MASKNQLETWMANGVKNYEKIEATIERVKKQAEKKKQVCIKLGIEDPDNQDPHKLDDTDKDLHWDQYWALNEYKDKLEQIRENYKKLEELDKKMQGYKEELAKIKSKEDAIPDVPVINEFLENWKTKALEWQNGQAEKFYIWRETNKDRLRSKDYKERHDAYDEMKLMFDNLIVTVMANNKYNLDETAKALEVIYTREVEAKKMDLFSRVMAVTGTITDAIHLDIASNGNLNGYILGEKGKAKVETILAGGYNIQCLHYRTLVNKIK